MGAAEREAAVEVFAEATENGHIVYADGLAEVGEECVVALRLELAVEGEAITVEAMAEGVIVTVAWVHAGCVRILADGVFETDMVCRVTGGRLVRVSAVDAYGYRWGEDGVGTFSMTVRKEEESVGGTDGERDTQEEDTEYDTAIVTDDNGSDRGTGSVTEGSVSTEPSGEPEREGKYIGCQETAVRDGVFAVRFWFEGDRTPVICMEGDGVIEVICETGIHTSCTFRGLSAKGVYRFWIYEGSVMIEVIYQNGLFFEQGVKAGQKNWYSSTILLE